jgi:cephalosporin hydroxylase
MLRIDIEQGRVEVETPEGTLTHALDSREAFELISEAWLRCGWDNKYVYSFSWLGRPVVQLPEDLLRMQEVIWNVQPDSIVETGVAHGGSLIFYATLCKAMERGRVIGIDVEIRPHNRCEIEAHPLFPLIQLIEGSSIDPGVVTRVESEVANDEHVLVILDSNHTKEHVLAELEAYAPLVSPGSYVVVQDGVMAKLAGAPRSKPDWSWNNPLSAIDEFLTRNPEFVMEEPAFAFNEGNVRQRITYWPNAFLRRLS